MDPSAVGDERVVVIGCAFSGAGAVTSGVGPTSPKAYFKTSIGLESTYPRAAYSITGNAVGFAATQNVAFKLAGATTEQDAQLFTTTANRATYNGSKPRRFLVQAVATLETSNANQVLEIAFAVNGTPLAGYRTRGTTQGPNGDRLENLSLSAVIELTTGQYVELWAYSRSSSTTVTWTEGQVILAEIGGG